LEIFVAPRAKKRLGRPPASDGAQTKQRILAAATQLFGERGYERSTNKDIAAAAGLTMPSIYYYYPSKSDLYAGVCGAVTEITSEIGHRVIAEEKGFIDRISRLVREVAEANVAMPSAAAFVVTAPIDAEKRACDHLMGLEFESGIQNCRQRAD